MIEYVLFGTLVALTLSSNIFWAIVCLKLTNRIMSKNYFDLAQADRKPQAPTLVVDDLSDPVAERHAKELNSIMGIV